MKYTNLPICVNYTDHEDSSFQGCDTVLFDNWIPAFQGIMVPLSFRVSSPSHNGTCQKYIYICFIPLYIPVIK